MGNLPEEIPRTTHTFAENTQTIIGLEMSMKISSLWGYSYFSCDMRVFLFKMHTNILGLNNRVAHFVDDHSPICTFCRIMRMEDARDEDTLHLFYSCPQIEGVKDDFFRWAYREADNYFISRNEFFLIQLNNGESNSTTIFKTIFAKFFMKYIWDCRNRYCLPQLDDSKGFLKSNIKTIIDISTKMRGHFNDSGLAHIFQQG